MTASPNDRGLTLGDGLFETILTEAGRMAFWDEHAARLTQGCGALGLPVPDPVDLLRAAEAALDREGLRDARAAVRLTWTAGQGGRGLDRPQAISPVLFATAAPAPAPSGPARLATSAIRRNETSPASRLKTLSYLDQVLARREAAQSGADEALTLNTKGEIACAAAANIFWVADGVLHTPALECGVLDGIIRGEVLARSPLPVTEVRATREALVSAQAIFLTSSLIGVRAVSMVDDREVDGAGLVRQIAEACL